MTSIEKLPCAPFSLKTSLIFLYLRSNEKDIHWSQEEELKNHIQ